MRSLQSARELYSIETSNSDDVDAYVYFSLLLFFFLFISVNAIAAATKTVVDLNGELVVCFCKV